MFAVAWGTALRAGESQALTTADLDFARKTVNKSSDDHTREVRRPKTPTSIAVLPMPSALESTLRNYLPRHWQSNAPGLLFPNRRGTRPRLRDNVFRYGLKPAFPKPLRNGKASMAVDDPANSLTSCGYSCRTGPDWLAHVSAFLLDPAARLASGFEGSAGASPSRGHPHDNEHLHASDA
jgi:hypothetical protein